MPEILGQKVVCQAFGLYKQVFIDNLNFKKVCSKVELLSDNNVLVAKAWTGLNVISPIILIFLSLINIVVNSYNPFLYFQF